MSQEKKHHHLIVGEIVFTHQDAPEHVQAIRTNGVLVDDGKDIPVRLLGKAQQILQLNFHQKMQDDKVTVVDVLLLDFCYLGHMTQDEFHKVPDGVELKEKAKSEPVQGTIPLEEAVAQAK